MFHTGTVYQCSGITLITHFISVPECVCKCTVYQCSQTCPWSHSSSVFLYFTVNQECITVCFSVHYSIFMSSKFVCVNCCLYLKLENIFQIWEYPCHWQLLLHQGGWKCHWGPCTIVHNLELGVANPSCMGKGKGTDHVVNVHECISTCLELVLPFKLHHSVKLLGSVLLHLLLPCLLHLYWWGGKPLGVLQVSGVPFKCGVCLYLVRIHLPLQTLSDGALCWGYQLFEMGML